MTFDNCCFRCVSYFHFHFHFLTLLLSVLSWNPIVLCNCQKVFGFIFFYFLQFALNILFYNKRIQFVDYLVWKSGAEWSGESGKTTTQMFLFVWVYCTSILGLFHSYKSKMLRICRIHKKKWNQEAKKNFKQLNSIAMIEFPHFYSPPGGGHLKYRPEHSLNNDPIIIIFIQSWS